MFEFLKKQILKFLLGEKISEICKNMSLYCEVTV